MSQMKAYNLFNTRNIAIKYLKIDYNGIMIIAVLLFSFEKCVMITNILLLFNKTCSFIQNKFNLIGVLRPRKAQCHQKPSTDE